MMVGTALRAAARRSFTPLKPATRTITLDTDRPITDPLRPRPATTTTATSDAERAKMAAQRLATDLKREAAQQKAALAAEAATLKSERARAAAQEKTTALEAARIAAAERSAAARTAAAAERAELARQRDERARAAAQEKAAALQTARIATEERARSAAAEKAAREDAARIAALPTPPLPLPQFTVPYRPAALEPARRYTSAELAAASGPPTTYADALARQPFPWSTVPRQSFVRAQGMEPDPDWPRVSSPNPWTPSSNPTRAQYTNAAALHALLAAAGYQLTGDRQPTPAAPTYNQTDPSVLWWPTNAGRDPATATGAIQFDAWRG
jgi:hypothetical protein